MQETPSLLFQNRTQLTDDDGLFSFGGTSWGVLLDVVIFLYSFLGLAIICDEHLVISLETLCVRWMVREDVAGATFMAFGSAAPEIIVNAVTTLKASASTSMETKKLTNLGVGAIVGSGVIAFALIPASCAILSHHVLHLKRRPLLRDIVAYAVALLGLCLSFRDGRITLVESSLLICVYVVYLLVVVLSPSLRYHYHVKFRNRPFAVRQTSFVEEREQLVQGGSSRVSYMAESDGADGDSVFGNVEEGEPTQADNGVAEGADDRADSDELEDELGIVGTVMDKVGDPWRFLFSLTCPNCERGSKWECLYPLTFLLSFVWISVLSFVLSSIVEHWGRMTGIPFSFFGFALIAIGAEIPDVVQSVTVAKRGYGSMAISNALGSQIVNICIGVGLPWTLSNLSGVPIFVSDHLKIRTAAILQGFNVALFAVLLLGHAWYFGLGKAELTKKKGFVMLASFVTIQVAFGIFVAVKNAAKE